MTTVDYSKLPADAMFKYINQTHDVLAELLSIRKEYAAAFTKLYNISKPNRLIITGSGTSFHCGESVRAFMETVLGITAIAEYPRLLENYYSVMDERTIVIAVSQSGESKSTLHAAEYVRSKGAKVVSICGEDHGHSLTGVSDLNLSLHCGEELAGPKTKGYQASMMALVLIALETAHTNKSVSDIEYEDYISRLTATVNNIPSVIDESIRWYERNENELMKAKRFIVVGSENNYGNVLEGRLKLEESIRFGVEGYELEEFMHGIYHSIDENVQLFYIAQSGRYKDRTFKLKNFLTDYSSHEYAVGDFSGMPDANDPRDLSMKFVDDSYFCCFEYIIPFQIVSFRLSQKKGINANIPKIPNFHHLMGSK